MAHLALLSVVACVVVAGCGGSDGGRLPAQIAQPPWSAPALAARVAADEGVFASNVVVSPQGREIVAFDQGGGPASCQSLTPPSSYVVSGGVAGPFGSAQPLGADLVGGPVLTADGASVLSTAPLRLPGASDCGAAVKLVVNDVNGATGRITPTILASGFTPGVARIASNRRGDVAVAWVEVNQTGVTHSLLRVAVRRRGQSFGRPVLVATNRAYGGFDVGIADLAIAADDAGNVLIAYEATPVLNVVTLGTDGVLGRRQRLATLQVFTGLISAATGGGRAFVVWGDQPSGMDGPQGPYRIQAAIRRSPDASFSAPALLDPGSATSADPSAGPRVVAAADGAAVVEWDHPDSRGATPHAVEVAIAPVGRPFAAGAIVSTNGRPGKPAIADDGMAVIPWLTNDDQVAVAIRQPRATRLDQAELVTNVAGTRQADPTSARPTPAPARATLEAPTAAFGPGREPLVAWGAHFQSDPREDVLQISTRAIIAVASP
jgi:hypothetical protein